MEDFQIMACEFLEIYSQEEDSNIKPGLYYGGDFVSPLIPRLEKIIVIKKGSENEQTKYLVHLIQPGVRDYGEKLLNNRICSEPR